jgi:hypothetical protein
MSARWLPFIWLVAGCDKLFDLEPLRSASHDAQVDGDGPPPGNCLADAFDSGLDASLLRVVNPARMDTRFEGGELVITPPPNTAEFNGVATIEAHDLTNGSVQIDFLQGLQTPDGDSALALLPSLSTAGTEYIAIYQRPGKLWFEVKRGNDLESVEIPYVAGEHRSWRIRIEDTSTLVFETNAASGSGFVEQHRSTNLAWSVPLYAVGWAGMYNTLWDSVGEARFDNFKLCFP